MRILIVYASKHGATEEIARHIAVTLGKQGISADVQSADAPGDLSGYDGFIVGSAVYYGSWLREATGFVETHQAEMANRPLWLFSSGPISKDTIDDGEHDLRETLAPKQLAELQATLDPRDHRVFFGVLDRGKLRFVDRLIASMPAFPGDEGDFRDWDEIDAWSEKVAGELFRPSTPEGRHHVVA